MEKDYNLICKAAPEFAKHSLLDFMKTRTLVNSRIFGVKVDGEDNDSIVPFADMFNYKYMSNMTYWTYDETRHGFVVKAKEDIARGKEVFVLCRDRLVDLCILWEQTEFEFLFVLRIRY